MCYSDKSQEKFSWKLVYVCCNDSNKYVTRAGGVWKYFSCVVNIMMPNGDREENKFGTIVEFQYKRICSEFILHLKFSTLVKAKDVYENMILFLKWSWKQTFSNSVRNNGPNENRGRKSIAWNKSESNYICGYHIHYSPGSHVPVAPVPHVPHPCASVPHKEIESHNTRL